MNRHNINPLRVEMLRCLKERYHDKAFCKGVYVTLHTDQEVIRMTEWLTRHHNEDISRSEIILKAMELKYKKRLVTEDGLETRD